MANREFNVRVWKAGDTETVVVRISAADARAAQAAAEYSGWTVDGVEELSPAPPQPATLESLQAELRDLRANIDLLHRAPIIRHPYQTVFWGILFTSMIMTLLGLVLTACLRSHLN
jgi:hypothetical protein